MDPRWLNPSRFKGGGVAVAGPVEPGSPTDSCLPPHPSRRSTPRGADLSADAWAPQAGRSNRAPWGEWMTGGTCQIVLGRRRLLGLSRNQAPTSPASVSPVCLRLSRLSAPRVERPDCCWGGPSARLARRISEDGAVVGGWRGNRRPDG